MLDLTFGQLLLLRVGDRIDFAGCGRVLPLYVRSRLEDVDRAARTVSGQVERRSIRVTATNGCGPGSLVECEWFAVEGQLPALTVVYG